MPKKLKKLVEMSYSGIKNSISRINPLEQSINKNDTADTGFEGIKLANQNIKKGKNTIKTVNNTIKTSKRTIKTTGKIIQDFGRILYKVPHFTVRVINTTAKVTALITAHAAALLMNPLVIIILGFLLICMNMAGEIITIIAGDNTNKEATTSAAGLIEVDEQYNNGVDFFNTAYSNAQDSFDSLIDSMYFSNDDLTNSDLVYMEKRGSDVLQSIYEKGFASDDYKNIIKSSWDLFLDKSEVLAITYVYLEKEQNTSNKTSLEIYEVTYTQEVLDMILSKYVSFTDTVYNGQKCPDGSCTAHVNPEYQEAVDNLNMSADAYNDWGTIIPDIEECYSIPDGAAQSVYWDENIQWKIDNWLSVYSSHFDEPYYTNNGQDFLNYLGSEYERYDSIEANTPKTLDECEYKHELYSIDLRFYTSEDVMNQLNFTDAEKQWVNLTEMGFESNPDIT